jgi:regulator of sigma E protease
MESLLQVLRVIGLIFLVLMVFNLMIVVHEWGHFLAARWRGLKIEKFYVWFGKPLWKKTFNGVEYGLGSIPMGGFVALPQMAPMDAIEGKVDEPREVLPPITPLDKIIVAFAGPLFSFLLAVFFAVVVWLVGRPEYQIDTENRIGYVGKDTPAERAGLKPGDEILNIDGKRVRGFRGLVDSVTWHIVSSQGETIDFLVKRPGVAEALHVPVKAEKPKEETQPTSWWRSLFTRPAFRQAGINPVQTLKIAGFMDENPNTPAQEAGLKKGDVIRKVGGEPVLSLPGLSDALATTVGKPVPIEIERDGNPLTVTVTPRLPDQRPADFNLEQAAIITLGVSSWDVSGKRVPNHPSPVSQIRDAARTISETLRAITSSKSDIGASHLSGFIGIANVYYNLLQDPQGWQRVMWFSVVLNVNLALLNLLPFPVLDGGHITMAILEWIRRKPLNVRILEVMQTACVLLLLGFMVFISFKDTGDVFGIGRKSDASSGEKIEPKFLAPEKRPNAK